MTSWKKLGIKKNHAWIKPLVRGYTLLVDGASLLVQVFRLVAWSEGRVNECSRGRDVCCLPASHLRSAASVVVGFAHGQPLLRSIPFHPSQHSTLIGGQPLLFQHHHAMPCHAMHVDRIISCSLLKPCIDPLLPSWLECLNTT